MAFLVKGLPGQAGQPTVELAKVVQAALVAYHLDLGGITKYRMVGRMVVALDQLELAAMELFLPMEAKAVAALSELCGAAGALFQTMLMRFKEIL